MTEASAMSTDDKNKEMRENRMDMKNKSGGREERADELKEGLYKSCVIVGWKK